MIVIVVDTIVADDIVVADTADVVVAEDERSSNVVVQTF